MTPIPAWPWYDPTTAPPPTGVEVLIRKRDGKYATGIAAPALENDDVTSTLLR